MNQRAVSAVPDRNNSINIKRILNHDVSNIDRSYSREKDILPTLGQNRLIMNYNSRIQNRNIRAKNITPLRGARDKYSFDISYNLKLANPVNNGRVMVKNIY